MSLFQLCLGLFRESPLGGPLPPTIPSSVLPSDPLSAPETPSVDWIAKFVEDPPVLRLESRADCSGDEGDDDEDGEDHED